MKLKKREKIFYLAGFLLLLISFLYDRQILSLFSNLNNSFLTKISLFFEPFVVILLIFFIISLLMLYKIRKIKPIAFLWLSIAISLALSVLLKAIIARPRPLLSLISITGSSFPSNHAAAMFAALPILIKHLPKFKYLWIFLAVLVSLSRLFLGVHYPSDIITGAILGYTIGLILKWKL